MIISVVGTQFSKSLAEGLEEGSEVVVSHDPTNEYDEDALAVNFGSERLGYIGKNSDLYKESRDDFPKRGYVTNFYRSVEGDKFEKHDTGTIVSCEVSMISEEPKATRSFTEDVDIIFDEVLHTYTYKGKKLKSGTAFIKKYLTPFDVVPMADRLSSTWGLPSQSIQDAWKLNQEFAVAFGNGIHKALEFEDLYSSFSKKDGSRCFNIKHPGLRAIVEEFFQLYDSLGFEGVVLPEVLLSDVENGLCGTADRLLILSENDKTCRIQDYKVNHSFNVKGSEKIVGLPEGMKLENTKLSKLSLQLKFYARMLEKAGWTVEGFDAFVYTDKWEYFEADTLEGFDILNNTFTP